MTPRIPRPSKEVLERMYNDECMTQYQISRKFNVVEVTVHKWLRNYNISTIGHKGAPINGSIVSIPPKEVIQRMYLDECMTQEQIGKEFNVGESTVRNWLQYYNISTVGRMGAKVPIPPKEVLERMYIDDGMDHYQISREFNVVGSTVHKWLRNYNIQSRVPMPPKDDLLNYIADGLNQLQIAEKCNVSDVTIFRWCEYYGISGMVNNFRCTTPEHIEWRDAVFERDNYTCQECGSQDNLQAHHIKPYCDYPELELDVDNGITLCERCHKQTFGREYQYIVKYEDIVLRDRCIGDCS